MFNKNNPTNKWSLEEKLDFSILEDGWIENFIKVENKSKFDSKSGPTFDTISELIRHVQREIRFDQISKNREVDGFMQIAKNRNFDKNIENLEIIKGPEFEGITQNREFYETTQNEEINNIDAVFRW